MRKIYMSDITVSNRTFGQDFLRVVLIGLGWIACYFGTAVTLAIVVILVQDVFQVIDLRNDEGDIEFPTIMYMIFPLFNFFVASAIYVIIRRNGLKEAAKGAGYFVGTIF